LSIRYLPSGILFVKDCYIIHALIFKNQVSLVILKSVCMT
jgi:hypothetical protein